MTRELRLALLLLLAGAALLLVGAGRTWYEVVEPAVLPLAPRVTRIPGSEAAGAVGPLGLVALAGVAALAATRGTGRIVVGALIALAGLAAGAATLAADGPPQGGTTSAWPYTVLLGALLTAAAGLLVALRGRRWAALSGRYDAPATRPKTAARPEVQTWDALDRGEDPTAPATRPARDESSPPSLGT